MEGWIPMYMTGQISPYYLKDNQNRFFSHLLKVSGAAALSGEAIVGHHENGIYYLTKNKKELAIYRKSGRGSSFKGNSAYGDFSQRFQTGV